MKLNKKTKKTLISLLILILLLPIYYYKNDIELYLYNKLHPNSNYLTIEDIPKYSSEPYVLINNNQPFFYNEELNTIDLEQFSPLDKLGRCGVVIANVSKKTMPTKERESIGQIKPSGWHTIKYDIVKDKYLYNRCHLIGYQLTGQNANPNNLITCTSHMNKDVMLTFENKVADYIKETNNHVLYRVTPYYNNDDLVAYGVEIEAQSIEDNGVGLKYNVFIYNIEPGININYTTGDSSLK